MKKIRKKKQKTFGNPKMGRPSLEEKELDSKQKEFAILIARGVPEDAAGRHCSFSDYQVKRYLNLQLIKNEVRYWMDIFGKEDSEKFIALYNKITETAFLELIKRIEGKTDGVISEENLMAIFNGKVISMGLSDPAITEKTKLATEKEALKQTDNKNDDNKIEFDSKDIELPNKK